MRYFAGHEDAPAVHRGHHYGYVRIGNVFLQLFRDRGAQLEGR